MLRTISLPVLSAIALVCLAGRTAVADYTYVADLDPAANYVTEVRPDGTVVRPWRFEHGNIRGIAADGHGSLYVAHQDIAGGEPTVDKIGNGTVTTFSIPLGVGPLAVDATGDLFVAQTTYTGSAIIKIAPNGTQTTYADLPAVTGGLAFGPDGNLYASANLEGQILKIASDGSFTTYARGLANPLGIAFGTDGTLYAANWVPSFPGGSVAKIDTSGHVTTLANLFDATDVAVDSAGHLLATNDGNYPPPSSTSSFHDLDQIDTTTGAVTQISNQFFSPFYLASSPVQVVPEPGMLALCAGAPLLVRCKRRMAARHATA